jgi:hypothetical protein
VSEIVEIQRRLAAMVAAADESSDVGAELGQIRADLRRLAAEHEEIMQRLAPILWDAPRPAD